MAVPLWVYGVHGKAAGTIHFTVSISSLTFGNSKIEIHSPHRNISTEYFRVDSIFGSQETCLFKEE